MKLSEGEVVSGGEMVSRESGGEVASGAHANLDPFDELLSVEAL